MQKEPKGKAPGIDNIEERVKFDYIKSNYFRVLQIDGVFGGNSPRPGIIDMAVWNERWPIPKQTVQKIEEGKIGAEVFEERVIRDAIVREVEVMLRLNIETAKVMRDWLDNKIKGFEQIVAIPPEGDEK